MSCEICPCLECKWGNQTEGMKKTIYVRCKNDKYKRFVKRVGSNTWHEQYNDNGRWYERVTT